MGSEQILLHGKHFCLIIPTYPYKKFRIYKSWWVFYYLSQLPWLSDSFILCYPFAPTAGNLYESQSCTELLVVPQLKCRTKQKKCFFFSFFFLFIFFLFYQLLSSFRAFHFMVHLLQRETAHSFLPCSIRGTAQKGPCPPCRIRAPSVELVRVCVEPCCKQA